MELKVAFSKMNNAGDLFNEVLIEWITGRKVVHSKIHSAELLAIGSGLNGLQADKYRSLDKAMLDATTLHIWGTGFIQASNGEPLIKNNLTVHAVRGKMSLDALSELTSKKIDVPTADPGLLISEFVRAPSRIRFKIGLIPHLHHVDNKIIRKLSEDKNVHQINMDRDPIQVAKEIVSCECILSSSLHGLIFSDSLNVPNLHIVGGDNLIGGTYKFQDYYSSYGMADEIYDPLSEGISIETICDYYRVRQSAVHRKAKQLLKVFPKELIAGEGCQYFNDWQRIDFPRRRIP